MKKNDLKKIIKPLVKECINEILIEEGLLSSVVSEVAAGLSAASVLSESTPAPTPVVRKESRVATAKNTKKQINEYRRQLMDSIGSDAYNGVDLFEGTAPMNSYEAASPKAGSVDLGDPADSGVNISSLVGDASKIWRAMK
tara:strand:+ start:571 stop:993 length:423 start_codon:yes stop_codon:yes gene_type:complete